MENILPIGHVQHVDLELFYGYYNIHRIIEARWLGEGNWAWPETVRLRAFLRDVVLDYGD